MNLTTHLSISILFVIFFVLNILVTGDDPITSKEKAALAKFLPMVESYLTSEHMKTDDYLIRWLRAKNLDLQDAKTFLLRNLEWRKENNIDAITEVDTTSAVGKAFPLIITQDRQGRPVYIMDWSGDIRKLALSGKGKEWTNHVGASFELVEKEIYKSNNNTQFIGIYDFAKFSPTTHMCIRCLPLHLEHAGRYEKYYPLRSRKFYAVNAPRGFQALLRLIGPVIGKTSSIIYTFDSDQRKWMPELLKEIAPEHLPVKYGGTL